jgi:hypothetical protein
MARKNLIASIFSDNLDRPRQNLIASLESNSEPDPSKTFILEPIPSQYGYPLLVCHAFDHPFHPNFHDKDNILVEMHTRAYHSWAHNWSYEYNPHCRLPPCRVVSRTYYVAPNPCPHATLQTVIKGHFSNLKHNNSQQHYGLQTPTTTCNMVDTYDFQS